MSKEKKEVEEKEEVTTKELKAKAVEARKAEIQGYYSELEAFLKERNIDLGANVVIGEGPNQVQIFIIDKL